MFFGIRKEGEYCIKHAMHDITFKAFSLKEPRRTRRGGTPEVHIVHNFILFCI